MIISPDLPIPDLFCLQKKTLEHLGAVTDVEYSPDGRYLVACDVNRKVSIGSKFQKWEQGVRIAQACEKEAVNCKCISK